MAVDFFDPGFDPPAVPPWTQSLLSNELDCMAALVGEGSLSNS